MGKPGPKAYSVINDLLKKVKGKSPLKAMYGNKPMKRYMDKAKNLNYDYKTKYEKNAQES